AGSCVHVEGVRPPFCSRLRWVQCGLHLYVPQGRGPDGLRPAASGGGEEQGVKCHSRRRNGSHLRANSCAILIIRVSYIFGLDVVGLVETLQKLTRRQLDALQAIRACESPERGAPLKSIA